MAKLVRMEDKEIRKVLILVDVEDQGYESPKEQETILNQKCNEVRINDDSIEYQ